MPTSSVQDLSGLINQYKNKAFEGFNLQVDDDRVFDELLTEGGTSGLNLYGAPEWAVNNLSGFQEWLKGNRAQVVVNGQKLFETTFQESDLRFGGSSETLNISIPESFKDADRINEILPDLSNQLPENVSTIRDLSRALGIDDSGGVISFRPIQKAKEEVRKAESGDKDSQIKLVAVALIGGAVLWSLN